MYESKRQYQYGTGRRKSSVARVRVYQGGTGSITINGRDIDDYFGLDTLKMVVAHLSSASDNLQLKNAKKARKYAIFRAFSMPKILSGLFGFDGI